MNRGPMLLLVLVCIAIGLYDANLVFISLHSIHGSAINWGKVGLAIVSQAGAIAFTVWYAAFVRRKAHLFDAYLSRSFALRVKFLPAVVVPLVLSGVSIAYLHIGLLCGEQSFPSVRGRPVCPAPDSH